MDVSFVVLVNLALASIAFNIYQHYERKKLIKTRPESLELREFLADMLGGRALLRIERVDGANLFIQDPGGR